jgi:hypothetical protein
VGVTSSAEWATSPATAVRAFCVRRS